MCLLLQYYVYDDGVCDISILCSIWVFDLGCATLLELSRCICYCYSLLIIDT